MRNLTRNATDLSTVFERLASGQRINRASDDPAGLAIADSLRTDVRILNQGLRNINDGIGLTSIAEGALSSLSDVLTRIEELSQQAANGTYSATQRSAMDTEAQALRNEYNRIVDSTKYNGIDLFGDQAPETIYIQAGRGSSAVVGIDLGAAETSSSFTGGFTATGVFAATGSGNQELSYGDINGDGNTDVVALGVAGVRISLGQGDGTFVTGALLASGGNPSSVTVQDANNDGQLDILFGHYGGGALYHYLNQGSGTFGTVVTFNDFTQTTVTRFGDIDGDGDLDAVSSHSFGTGGSDHYYTRRASGGTYSAASSVFVASSGNPLSLEIADLNNDGRKDVVVFKDNGGWISSFLNDSSGNGTDTWGNNSVYLTPDNVDFRLGDVTGDGNIDLIARANGAVHVYDGQGNGSFNAPVSYALGAATGGIALGDVTGDGVLDIAALRSDGIVNIYSNGGSGSFTLSASVATGGSLNRNQLQVADITGDGVGDLLVARNDGQFEAYVANAVNSSDVSNVTHLDSFSLLTISDALSAKDAVGSKRAQVQRIRSSIGVSQTRLETLARVIDARRLNYISAESRIRDADIAEESAKLIALTIRQQVATSLLAQANQISALALKLIQR